MKKTIALAVLVAMVGLVSSPASATLDTITMQDDFTDGNYTGWNVTNGTWSAASNYLEETTNANTYGRINTSSGSLQGKWEMEFNVRFRSNYANYSLSVAQLDTSNGRETNGYYVGWLTGSTDTLSLYHIDGTTRTTLATTSLAPTSMTWYTITFTREDLNYDGNGTNSNIWVDVDGGAFSGNQITYNESGDALTEFDGSTATHVLIYDRFGDNLQHTHFDDMTLSTVPEPATMVLLALGLPLALRRKRK